MTQVSLGSVLEKLGARGGTEPAAGVEAHHLALKELTRERAPLVWAKTQGEPGQRARKLGERERHRPPAAGRRGPTA
jgi:hypothetical protein